MVAQRVATSGGNADDVAIIALTLQNGSAQEQAYVRDNLGEQMSSAVTEGYAAKQKELNDEFRQRYGVGRNQLGGYSVDVASVLPLGRMLKWLDFGAEIVQGFKGAAAAGAKIENVSQSKGSQRLLMYFLIN